MARRQEGVNFGVAYFTDFSTAVTNEMMMAGDSGDSFVLCRLIGEVVPQENSRAHQNFHSIVDGCAGNMVPGINHGVIERVNRKMAVEGKRLVKDGKTFRSFPQSVFFKKTRKSRNGGIYLSIIAHFAYKDNKTREIINQGG